MRKLPKHIEAILSSIALSPSSHNTQPWYVSWNHDTLFFFGEERRKLKFADPTDREFYISIGCCIANAIIQAEALGFSADVEYFPNEKDSLYVAKLVLQHSEASLSTYASLAACISTRVSNRGHYYAEKKIPKAFVQAATDISKKKNISFDVVTDTAAKKKLAQITKDAIKAAISTPNFRNELMSWVRHNWTKKNDGMPGFAIGLSSVPSILFPALIHSPQMPEEISKSEYDMVLQSSGVGIISIPKDEKEIWVQTGIVLEYIWLLATQNKLSMSLLSGAVEMDEQRKQVADILGSNELPSVFFRIGFAKEKALPSPRRSVDEIYVSYEEITQRVDHEK